MKRCPLSRIVIFISLFSITVSGCSVLTKSQIERVSALSVSSDTLAIAPSVILKELSNIRVQRGLYYATSLSSVSLKIKELDNIAEYSVKEEKLFNSVDAYVSILNSYLRALKSISADVRWRSIGTELRGIGRNIDSLIIKYNQSGWSEKLPVGFAKVSGRASAEAGEWIMRNRQAKLVRDYVMSGDSLVKICTSELVEILKKGGVNELIEHESESLKLNYLSYVTSLENRGVYLDISSAREYITLSVKIENIKKTRDKAISGLQSLKRSHSALIPLLKKRRTEGTLILDEIIELNAIALEVTRLIKQLEQ